MHLNPYGEDPVRLAMGFAARPPRTPDELTRRCTEAGVVIERPADERDLDDVLDFLDRWLSVVDADSHQRRAELLNELLAESSAHPRMTDHTGTGWHLHYRDDHLGLAGVVRALLSVGTALHLTGRGVDRLGRCTLTECANAYADFSRGGRQRYCSPACANRDAVRRHRAKQSA